MAAGDVSDQFFKFGENRSDRYANPFYNIPQQYQPTNMDGMLWWSEHFLLKFGFYRNALQRICNYFITEITVDCDDEESVKEYKEMFDTIKWKQILSEAGLNLLAYGNSYVSLNQGFNRFLNCPQCHKFSLIDRLEDFTFEKGKYTYRCPACQFKGVHRLVDKPIKDLKKLNPYCWNPREVKVQFEEMTGQSAYFWQIPGEYKKKVTMKGSKFYPKFVPKAVYDAVFEEKMLEFNKRNFIHLKIATPASLKTDGRALPLAMYMFDDFFMLKVLERFNEVICFEDINPFRVISMADNVQMAHPILSTQDGGQWKAAVDAMIETHRRDPGNYATFPYPLNFQYLNREGKNLAPVELIEYAQNNILNSLNIPQELYKMTLQAQAAGPALRLFENSWSFLIDAYNQLLQHIGDVVSNIRGLAPAKFSLLSTKFADDMERKSVIGQLMSSNSIARTEFLKLFGLDFEDQVRKKNKEDEIVAEIQEETAKRQQLKAVNKATIFGQQQGGQPGAGGGAAGMANSPGDNVGSGAGMQPQEILAQAQELAQQLFPADPATRRTELQKIKAQNETLWSSVKAQLQQMDSGAKSQGLKDAKGQGGQGGGQQPQ